MAYGLKASSCDPLNWNVLNDHGLSIVIMGNVHLRNSSIEMLRVKRDLEHVEEIYGPGGK